MSEFVAMFSYDFMTRAVLVGILVALCAALLGVSLVLKRYSMIGDGLSHVGFGTLAIGLAVGIAPLALAVPVMVAAAFLLMRLNQNSRIGGDAAIAILSTSFLAVGVIVVSLSTGMTTDVYSYLFGSVLALSDTDVMMAVVLCIAVLVLYLLFYHKFFLVTFDEAFARAAGVRVGAYNMLLAIMTALVIVVGMRIMGALLIAALIIFPALTAMRVFRTFRQVVLCAAILSAVCFFIGVALSYVLSLPTGASVVIVNAAAFGIFAAIGAVRAGKN